MKSSIFDYLDYKKYLADWIASRSSRGHGERSRIARVLRCHVAYFSRILQGGAQLSPEQAFAINGYLGHSPEEADFFLLLVHYGRVGTADLETHYRKKIQAEVERRNVLKNRLDYEKALPEVDQTTYFSAWYFAATHLLLSIPALQTKEALARYLRLSPSKVSKILSFLVASGLAIEKKGRYTRGPTSIHLGNDSPMISKHHTNWRLQAIQALEREKSEELHYSSAITIAEKYVPEIRKIMIQAIEQVRALVRESPEERLFCYTLDLFEVGHGET